MKKIIAALMFAATTTAACKKDSTKTANEICTAATIMYGGNPAADGVGWYISIPDSTGVKREYPENLSGAFMIDGLLVDICYVKTNKDFVCFCLPPLPQMVNITSIVKR
jgi:predicted small secreted protein